MHRSVVQPPAILSGPLLCWEPRVKLLLLLCYLLTLAAVSTAVGAVARAQFLALGLLLVILIWHSRISWWWILARSALILPFAGCVACAHLLTLDLAPDVLFRIPFTEIGIRYYPAGWERAALLVARAWLALAATLLVLGSTPPMQLFDALERLGVPKPLVLMLALVARYSFLLIDEARLMVVALRLRGMGRPLRALRSAGAGIVASLFVRTLGRAQRVYQSMLLRGFGGTLRSGADSPWTAWDRARFTAGVSLLLLIALLPGRWPA